jgi:hypothetical protein
LPLFYAEIREVLGELNPSLAKLMNDITPEKGVSAWWAKLRLLAAMRA